MKKLHHPEAVLLSDRFFLFGCLLRGFLLDWVPLRVLVLGVRRMSFLVNTCVVCFGNRPAQLQ